jgi:hypothetical protein
LVRAAKIPIVEVAPWPGRLIGRRLALWRQVQIEEGDEAEIGAIAGQELGKRNLAVPIAESARKPDIPVIISGRVAQRHLLAHRQEIAMMDWLVWRMHGGSREYQNKNRTYGQDARFSSLVVGIVTR